MRSIEFIKVVFNNYTCYTEEMVYEFHNSKIQLLIGANGTGKTNLFNSIPVCLYGMTADGRKGEDLVNNKVKKNCYIFLDFKIDNDLYVIKRYIKHSKEGSTVLLYKNDVLINKGHKEVLPVIESIFMPMRLFINLLYLTQKGEMFITLEDSKKKEIFEKMLDLVIYQTYIEKADKKIKDVIEELSNIRSKIDICGEMITTFDNQLSELENNAIKFENEKATNLVKLTTQVNSLEFEKIQMAKKLSNEDKTSELMQLISDISSSKNKINSILTKKQSDRKDMESKKETKLLEFKNRVSDEKSKIKLSTSKKRQDLDNEWNDKINILKNKLDSLNINIKNQKVHKGLLSDKLKKIKDEIDKRERELQMEIPVCVECGHELGENKNKILNIVNEFKKEFSTNEEEILDTEFGITNMSKEFGVLNNELSPLQLKYSEEKNTIDVEENSSINELMVRYNTGIRQLDELLKKKLSEVDAQFDIELNTTKQELEDLETTKFNIDSEISNKRDIESKINNINQLIAGVKAELKLRGTALFDDRMKNTIIAEKDKNENEVHVLNDLLNEKESKLSIYEFWKTGFSMRGIPSILIEESVPFINERLNFYLEKIGGRFKVSFDVLSETKTGGIRDKISISIFDTVTHGDSHKQLSGGQARLIDIIIILTLRDLMQQYCGFSINIVLFDEIFDGLDDENIAVVANLLRLLIEDQSYNIISHRHIDQIEYDEIYKTS